MPLAHYYKIGQALQVTEWDSVMNEWDIGEWVRIQLTKEQKKEEELLIGCLLYERLSRERDVNIGSEEKEFVQYSGLWPNTCIINDTPLSPLWTW